MLSKSEIDKKFAGQALKTGAPVTPAHSAAEGAVAADGDESAHRRRDRVQHEADPYLHEAPEVAEVDLAELGKLSRRFGDVADAPDGYPPMRLMDAEQFRGRGPAGTGHAAGSPGYGAAVPLPTAPLSPGPDSGPLFSRPPLGDIAWTRETR
jgi:hypothetical protein